MNWSGLPFSALESVSTSAHARTVKTLTGGLNLHVGGELLARRTMAGRRAELAAGKDSVGSGPLDSTAMHEKILREFSDAQLAAMTPGPVDLARGEALYRKLLLQRKSRHVRATTGVSDVFGSAEKDLAKVAGSFDAFVLAPEGTLRRGMQLAGKYAANFTRRHQAEMVAVAGTKFVIATPVVIYVIHRQKKHAEVAAAAAAAAAQPTFVPPSGGVATYVSPPTS